MPANYYSQSQPYSDPRADEIIQFLTNMNPDTRDPDTAAAEAAIFGGGGFSGARQYRERDLDRRKRFQEVVPFLGLRQSAALQTQGENARTRLSEQEAAQAMERQDSDHRQQILLDAGRQAAQQGNMELANKFNKEANQLKLQGELTMQGVGIAARAQEQQNSINAASVARAEDYNYRSLLNNQNQGSRSQGNQGNRYSDSATMKVANDILSKYPVAGSGPQVYSGTGESSYGQPMSYNQSTNPGASFVLSGTGEEYSNNAITGNTQSESGGQYQYYDQTPPNSQYGNFDSESNITPDYDYSWMEEWAP